MTQPMSAVHQYTSVPGFVVEHRVVGVRGLGEVPAGGVHDALGFPGGARGVQDEQRLLGGERLRGVLVGLGRRPVRPTTRPCSVQVMSMPVRRTTSTCSTGESAAATASSTAAFSGTAVPRRYCPSAVITTRACGVADPGAQRLGGEPGEDHPVGQAEAGAGQHREHRLGDHRQVDRHPVAGLEPQRDQRVRGLADLGLQLGVGDGRGCRRVRPPSGSRPCRRARRRRAGPRSCTATFSSPSANHFACGASDQSSTWVNGVAQVSRFACSAQNASGSAAARS